MVDYYPKTKLEEIIISYPNSLWKWDLLQGCSYITEGFLEKIVPSSKLSFYHISRNKNISTNFINKHIDKEWDIVYLLELPCINSELLEIMLDKRPDWWFFISSCKLLTMNLIRKMLSDKIDGFFRVISSNPNLCFKFVAANINESWMWSSLSRNKNLTFSFLKKNISKQWCIYGLIRNPNFTIEWIFLLINNDKLLWNDFLNLKNPEFCTNPGDLTLYQIGHSEPISQFSRNINIKDPYNKQFWRIGSSHKNININHLVNYNLPWDWSGFSDNPNITIDIVLYYRDKEWNWISLSFSDKLSLYDIENNKNLPWDWNCISYRKDLTNKFIKNHKDKLNFNRLSSCINIDMTLVEDLSEYTWNYQTLSSHPKLNLNLVSKLSDKSWKIGDIVKNPKFTIEDLVTYVPTLNYIKSNPNSIFKNINISPKYLINLDKLHCDIIIEEWCYLDYCNRILKTKYNYSGLSLERTINRLDLYRDELMKLTWNPNRIIDWCLDITDLDEIN